MSGTVMNFGPPWLRILTDGGAPSATPSSNSSSSATITSSLSSNLSSSTAVNSNNNSTNSTNNNNNNSNNVAANSATNSTLIHNMNNNNSNNSTTKFKLAEYRYGREEMLALFEPNLNPPEDIKKFIDLFVEKEHMPMAMTPMSEEEIKIASRTWNSDAVIRSSNKIASSGPGVGGINSLAGVLGSHTVGGSSSLNDRDIRGAAMSAAGNNPGVGGSLTAASVLSSSPRGPPGSLSRVPMEQRSLLTSMRGPSTMRNLVSRGPNLYMRSQTHDDESNEDGTTSINDSTTGIVGGSGGGSGGGGGAFSSRFSSLPGQNRQPNSLRTRFEPNSRTANNISGLSTNTSGVSGNGGLGPSKSIDITKTSTSLTYDNNEERRSVFDKLPAKSSIDDKNIRKDVAGRPLQAGDWRSREWSGNHTTEGRIGTKVSSEEPRSWRSSRAGNSEDWRSNNNSNTSSWYVRSDDQRNLRTVSGNQIQDPTLSSSYTGKRDMLKRPSGEERQQGDGGEEGDGELINQQQQSQHHNHHNLRHRRDSLPEWSISDPLSGDKVGSFDASGAFREIARDDGNEVNRKEKGRQDQAGYDMKSTGDTSDQGWRSRLNDGSPGTHSKNLNDIEAASMRSLGKLTLLDHNDIPNQNQPGELARSAPNESRINKNAISNRGEQCESIQNQISKKEHPIRRSPPGGGGGSGGVLTKEREKSIDIQNNAMSSRQAQILPSGLQQIFEKQHAFLNSIDPSIVSMHQSGNDEDGFAHLERAAEMMVAKWTADDEHEPLGGVSSILGGNKARIFRDLEAKAKMLQQNNPAARAASQTQQQRIHQQQQEQGQEQQTNQHHEHQRQRSTSEKISTESSGLAIDSNNQRKLVLLPFNHEDSQKWFYRDTQGVIQGPFSATEMFEWYKAGYFVKELLVRRACDEQFYHLGEVLKMWDRIPFSPIPMNVAPPPPITTQALIQFRAVTKQFEIASLNAAQPGQIPQPAFSLAHPGAVLLRGPIIPTATFPPQQQVLAAAASQNQNISGPTPDQQNVRQVLELTRQQQQQQQQQQHDPSLVRNPIPSSILEPNEMQSQLRQLLAQLKSREGFANLNAQEQQEILLRQFVARTMPGSLQQDQDPAAALLQQARMVQFLPFMSDEDKIRLQQRFELERQQKEEAEKQTRLIMEQRMKAEEEKQRIMDEMLKRKEKEESEKQRQEAEKDRLLKMSQLKQQQLAEQQEEFRKQMQKTMQQQQEKKQQQQQTLAQQQQIERAKKAAQAQQVQQEQQQQQRKTAWSTVSKPNQEPVSLATLQKMQEDEKEKEREKQRQLQSSQQQQHQQQQQHLQQMRQMTWASAASKAPVPIKTLAEIQKEEEERLAREKQKQKTKIQPTVASAGVWNNAASHLNWKNPPADSS